MRRRGYGRGDADPRDPAIARDRVEILRPKYGPRGVFCDECSTGTRQEPIPHTKKRVAEFAIKIGKHGYHTLCRACALRFAEDFFNQLEVLTGVSDGKEES